MSTTTTPGDWAGSPLSTLHHSIEVPNRPPTPTIVVGVSGSPASVRALRWAAGEAGRLRAQLKVVLIWTMEPRAYYAPAITVADYERRQRRAESGLAATVRTVTGPVLSCALTTYVAQGQPERALVEQAAGADLLVLGSASGLSGSRSIGPVIRACLNHAHCPVVVVGPEGSLGPAGNGRATDRSDATVSKPERDLLLAGPAPAQAQS